MCHIRFWYYNIFSTTCHTSALSYERTSNVFCYNPFNQSQWRSHHVYCENPSNVKEKNTISADWIVNSILSLRSFLRKDKKKLNKTEKFSALQHESNSKVSVSEQDPQGLSHSVCLKTVGSFQSYINNFGWFTRIFFYRTKRREWNLHPINRALGGQYVFNGCCNSHFKLCSWSYDKELKNKHWALVNS